MKKKQNWFKKKKIASVFALVTLVAGFLFLDQGITGNAVLNNNPAVNVISLVGLLLVFCAAILSVYSLRR